MTDHAMLAGRMASVKANAIISKIGRGGRIEERKMSISKNSDNIPVPKKWTPEDLHEMEKMRNEGHTLAEIGKKYSVSKNAIFQAFKRYDLKSNINKPEPKEGFKYCPLCKRELSLDSFYKQSNKKNGITSQCKECIKAKQKEVRQTADGKKKHRIKNQQWYIQNKDRHRQYSKNYIQRHPESRKKSLQKYYENHKGQIQEYAKSYLPKHSASCRKYYAKMQKDPVFNMIFRIRSLVYGSFKNIGNAKSKKTIEIIGMQPQEFHDYLLNTFKEIYGRDWDGEEEVNIDHIIPISTAKTEEDVLRLNHYTNLRLITKEDNLKKGKKINYKIGGFNNDKKAE